MRAKHAELQASYSETKAQLEKVQEYSGKLGTEMAKLEEVETEENQGYLNSFLLQTSHPFSTVLFVPQVELKLPNFTKKNNLVPPGGQTKR